MRIPYIVNWKGRIAPRVDNTFLGSLPDIYPTLLDLMGMKNQIPVTIDGKSYAQYYLNGKGKTPSEQFILGAIISDNVDINSGFRGVRTNDFKLSYVKTKGQNERVLFDLKEDPFEMINIYDPQHPMVKKLTPLLKKYLKDTGDAFVLD